MWIKLIQTCTLTSKSIIYIKYPFIFTLGNDIRDTRCEIYGNIYIQLRGVFVPMCLESHDKCYLNILRMITLLYNFYIWHEIYDMSYHKRINRLNDNLFIENTISKWNYFILFDEKMRKMRF